MYPKRLIDSFNYAIDGILYALRTQRNMRIHFVAGLLVLLLASIFHVSRLELVALLITIGLVISAEMMNTAIEEVVNLVTQEFHPLAKVAKNVAAGAVLVTSLLAVCVGYLVFIDKILYFGSEVFRSEIAKPFLTLIALIVVLILVIGIKVLVGWTNLLRGGLPSGHTAVAFALATAILYSGNFYVGILAYLLAALVAQSRVEASVHSLLEVVVGAVLGIVVTLLVFQIA